MAYDFLKETTYSDDDLLNGGVLSMIQEIMQREETEPGEGLTDDGDPLIEVVSNMEDDEEEEEEEYVNEDLEIPETDEIDPDLYNLLFADSEEMEDTPVTATPTNTNASGLTWLKTKSEKVNLGGIDNSIADYLSTLPDDLKQGLVATSGNDQSHAKGSKHYSGKAVDLRFNEDAYNHMKNDPNLKKLGLRVLDPNHGTAPHIHLEKYQVGGTLYADNQSKQQEGLNNPSYNKAFFPLDGTNTFRGLDSKQPVAVTDGKKYKILIGKNDTAKFNGNVYEYKL